MNNDNNIENNADDFNGFLPGVGDSMNNFNSVQPSNPQFTPQQDPNFNANMEPNQFGMNQMPNMEPNQFGMNQMPNMEPNQFGMNQMPNMEPSQFDMNQMPNMDPNQSGMNQMPNMDPNQSGMNQMPNMEPNQFDVNQMPNMEPNQFDVNQMPNMEPNQFDMNQGFEQTQYSDDYSEDFVKTWMGSIYEKAHSKKFNWCAALFGPAYLFYRKVYLTGALATLIFIIINVILSLLSLENPLIILGVDVVLSLVYFFGLGLGFYPIYKDFVHKQLEKYKKQFADNEQLIAVSHRKGGVSVVAVIVFYLVTAILSSALTFTAFSSLLSGLSAKIPQNTTNQTSQTNEVPEVLTDEFNFVDNYIITYPVSTWTVGTDDKSLVSGDYSLSYTITYKASDLGVSDMTSADGRASILTIINSSVTALATANNLQMEASTNFTMKGNSYYTYIDLSSDTNITRYYFIILPNDDVLIQFELTVNDTAIDYETNTEVIEMLTTISTDDTIDENEISNNLSLSNSINDTISNNIDVNETNSIGTNTIEETNNTITTETNSTVSNNTTVDNTTNSLVDTNSTNSTNNTINSSLGILQDID